MPTFHDLGWIVRHMRQFGFVGLSSKRPRRAVPYATELLERAKGVNYGRIRAKRHR